MLRLVVQIMPVVRHAKSQSLDRGSPEACVGKRARRAVLPPTEWLVALFEGASYPVPAGDFVEDLQKQVNASIRKVCEGVLEQQYAMLRGLLAKPVLTLEEGKRIQDRLNHIYRIESISLNRSQGAGNRWSLVPRSADAVTFTDLATATAFANELNAFFQKLVRPEVDKLRAAILERLSEPA